MPEVTELAAEISVEGAGQASRELDEFGRRIDQTGQKQQQASKRSADYDRNLQSLARSSLVVGGAMLAGFGFAAHASMEFGKEISTVGAVSDATNAELAQLSDAALEAGKSSQFVGITARDAAQAEGELARAGISVADILGGALTGSLSLASAGQLDVATAATIAAQALNIFNLEGDQTGHVADVLAAAANKSAADVEGLGNALRQGGLQAKLTGLSLEDTIGALALFADNALISEDAGTSLKSMLQRLTPQSAEAAALMTELGLEAYDARGQFIGLEDWAGKLQAGLQGLSEEQRNSAIATIFGTDAGRAAALVYDAGSKGVRDYRDAVNDVGAAQRMAADMTDNLAGDFEQLQGSIEGALIAGGTQANDALRALTQTATGLVNAFAEAPGWLQQTGVGLAGVGGSALLLVGVLGTIIPKARQARLALAAMSAGQTIALAGVVAALTVGAIAIARWAREKEQARQRANEFTDALRLDSGALGENTRALVKNSLQEQGRLDDLGRLKGHLDSGRAAFDVFTDAVGGNTKSQAEFRAAMIASGEVTVEPLGRLRLTAEQLRVLQEEFIRTGETQFQVAGGQHAMIRGNIGLLSSLDKQTAAQADARAAFEATSDAQRTAADVERDLMSVRREAEDLQAAGIRSGPRFEAVQRRLAAALREQQDVQAAGAGVTSESADSFEAFAEKVAEAEKAIDEYQDALDALIGVPVDLEKATIGWGESLADLNEQLFTAGTTLDIHTTAGRENRDAIIEMVEAAKDHAKAAAEQSGSIEVGNAVLAAHREELLDTLTQFGLTREAAEAYVNQLGLVPPSISTVINVTADTSAAIASLAAIGAKAVAIAGDIVVLQGREEGKRPGRASGGPVSAGETYLIGERGPELLVMPAGGGDGYVLPNGAAAAVGGATTQHFHFDKLVLPNVRNARQLVDELREIEREFGYSIVG